MNKNVVTLVTMALAVAAYQVAALKLPQMRNAQHWPSAGMTLGLLSKNPALRGIGLAGAGNLIGNITTRAALGVPLLSY